MLLSPCIEYVFQREHEDFCDRIRAASAAGFSAVEFHMWRNKSLEELERTLKETNLGLTSMLVEPRAALNDMSAISNTVSAMRESLVTAKRLQVPALVSGSGMIVADQTPQEQHDAIVKTLKQCAGLFEDSGITMLLEPVNTRVDHPGIFLDRTPEGLDIIEEVGSPRVRLLYDMYHSTCMGEDPAEVLGDRMHLVGHVQIADAPGRHEPSSGAINWKDYMDVLRAKGYQGAIGLEYRPSGNSLTSLQQTRQALGL